MATRRFEIRLDPERSERLRQVAKDEGKSDAEAFRRLMDLGYDGWMRDRRLEAVRRIAEIELPDDVPEPEELNRQLESTYDQCHLD